MRRCLVLLYCNCIWTHLFPCTPFMVLFFNIRGNEWQKFSHHSHSKEWCLASNRRVMQGRKINIPEQLEVVKMKANLAFLCYCFCWFMLCCVLSFKRWNYSTHAESHPELDRLYAVIWLLRNQFERFNKYIPVYLYIYTNKHIYMCAYVYVCIYMHIYIYNQNVYGNVELQNCWIQF